MTIAVAVVSVIVVVPIVCVASLDLAMIAFPMVLATMVVIAMAGVGQRQTAAGKQGDGNKQAADEFHPGFLRGRGRGAAASDSCGPP